MTLMNVRTNELTGDHEDGVLEGQRVDHHIRPKLWAAPWLRGRDRQRELLVEHLQSRNDVNFQ